MKSSCRKAVLGALAAALWAGPARAQWGPPATSESPAQQAQAQAPAAPGPLYTPAQQAQQLQQAQQAAAVVEVDTHTYNQEVVQETRVPVLVFFSAPWCGACSRIAPLVEDFAQRNLGRLKVVKLNVDDFPDLARDLGITSIPAFFLFDNTGGKCRKPVRMRPVYSGGGSTRRIERFERVP